MNESLSVPFLAISLHITLVVDNGQRKKMVVLFIFELFFLTLNSFGNLPFGTSINGHDAVVSSVIYRNKNSFWLQRFFLLH